MSDYPALPLVVIKDYTLVCKLVVNVGKMEACAFAPDNPCRWTAADIECALGLGLATLDRAHVGTDRKG